LGATLTATSIGITARVLRDLGFEKNVESKIIMAAAVFDDILGLLLLSFVTALVQTAHSGEISWLNLSIILLKTNIFIMVSWAVGTVLVPKVFKYFQKVLDPGSVFLCGLGLCFGFSLLAHVLGLAPILGAYFAGLMIETKELEDLMEKHLNPLAIIFVPLFFVMMGAKVDLSVLSDFKVIQLGVVLTVVAVLGKVLSGYVVSKKLNRLVIGVGMVPRGEVGLIFAAMGVSPLLGPEPVFSPMVFGAIVFMVILTSIISPIWLGRLLNVKPIPVKR
jgi:Kef-type K+ transport system membrane component KefB